MNILVDTSVWSLALRRNKIPELPEIKVLHHILLEPNRIVTTGIIVQELLQGFSGPTLADHIESAEIRNTCRRSGIQIGTVDALIAQLCIKYDLLLLSTDKDFQYAARHIPLKFYQAKQ